MRQPPSFEKGTGSKVCLLKKSVYGLKQSSRQWYKRFDVYMISNGFSRSSYNSCAYFKEFAPGMYIYLLLYVDDMLIACKSKSGIEYTKGLLRKEFDMKELGSARKIVSLKYIKSNKNVIGLRKNMVQTRQSNNPLDVMEIIAQQLQNIIPNIVTQVTNNLNNANGNGNGGGNNSCTYKGFLACGPRDFDRTGGAVALTRWIEKMESVIDNSGC
ncbi:retrovirus-related pol polyprotein from transposon TNT 1-94, partial [Tanacetum coccineum]